MFLDEDDRPNRKPLYKDEEIDTDGENEAQAKIDAMNSLKKHIGADDGDDSEPDQDVDDEGSKNASYIPAMHYKRKNKKGGGGGGMMGGMGGGGMDISSMMGGMGGAM